MPRADVTLTLEEHGASLRVIADKLRDMDEKTVTGLFRDHLEPAARPFVAPVQASVMATPRKRPPSPGGLRARIARTVEVASWGQGRQVSVAVEVQPQLMPDREHGLPLYYEGVAEGRHDRWRHPVFGRSSDPWVQEAPTPFFYQAASGFGRAAGDAMAGAVDDITRKISG